MDPESGKDRNISVWIGRQRMEKHFSGGLVRPTSGPPRPAATSPLTARLTWPGVGGGGGDCRRRSSGVGGERGPLHARCSAAQLAPEVLDSRNAAGSPAIEAELASGPPQPRPRPEAAHATERGSHELHLRAPGRAAPLAFRATSGCARFAVRQAVWAERRLSVCLGRRRLP